ncbi:MAG: hypothetical protein K2X27_20015 [Candidatus Obscuribacterales bacterium]|nr:hypothetical protein [Candidatus Obscuribacterales bacterium]
MHLSKKIGVWTFALLTLPLSASPAFAQYQAGQKVEYKVRSWPPGWKLGTVEYMTPSGKQVIVREKPDEYNPKGGTSAYALDEVRPFTGQAAPDPVDTAKAQFTPGMQVTYPGGVGTVEYVTPSGKQVIVREAPNQFYPQGNTRAYNLDELKAGGAPAAAQPAQTPQVPATAQPQNLAANIPQFSAPVHQAAANNAQLPKNALPAMAPGPAGPVMTVDDVINLFAAKIGDPKQLSWPQNEQVYAEVAKIIRDRGVDFRFDSAPQKLIDAVNHYQVFSNVTGAIRQNLGPPAKKDYFKGAWDMSQIGGETRVRQFQPGYDLVTSEHGAKAGDLVIDGNGHYSWNGISGPYRDATPEEMAQSDKGGAGIVLLDAKMGQRSKNWIVFKHSMTNGENIEVADLEYRTRREYGGRR